MTQQDRDALDARVLDEAIQLMDAMEYGKAWSIESHPAHWSDDHPILQMIRRLVREDVRPTFEPPELRSEGSEEQFAENAKKCVRPEGASAGGEVQTGDIVDLDTARLALFEAINAIKIGNRDDDKLILDNMRKAGFWICRVGDFGSTVAAATRAALEASHDAG